MTEKQRKQDRITGIIMSAGLVAFLVFVNACMALAG